MNNSLKVCFLFLSRFIYRCLCLYMALYLYGFVCVCVCVCVCVLCVTAEEIPVHLLRDIVFGCNSSVFFKSLYHLNGSLDCYDSISQRNRCFSIFLDAPSPFDGRRILDIEIQVCVLLSVFCLFFDCFLDIL